MEEVKMTELPLYKSNEFNIGFSFELKNDSLFEKFKKDGEITAEIKVRIKKCGSYHNYRTLYVSWHRPTAQGEEKLLLMAIAPSDGFLEFLDKLAEKKRSISFMDFGSYWVAKYAHLVAVCNFCKKNQEEFKKAVRKAKDINELVMLSGFRD